MTIYDKPVRQPQFRLIRVSILAVIIGILGGIAAEVLDRMIGLVEGRPDKKVVPIRR